MLGVIVIGWCWLAFPAAAQPDPSRATGRGGAVATVNPLATQVGLNILKKGGNAVDAAIATAAALGVVDPFSCGIGGGGYMLIYLPAEDRILTIDGRETAPLSASSALFQDPDSPEGQPLPFAPNRISSGAAVGVPGTVLTWTEALSRYGTLSLSELLAPAIELAERGFVVNETFARLVEQNRIRFAVFPATAALYLPQGSVPVVGSRLTNPDLARAYRLIARLGSNGFYRGALAQAIVNTVQHPPTIEQPPFRVVPGGMTLTDLDLYGVILRPPVVTRYHDYRVYSMGLSSGGGITSLETLNILEGLDVDTPDPVKLWHSVIESERLAYADRNAYLADPSFVDVPVAGLLSKDYARNRRSQIHTQAPSGGSTNRAKPGDPTAYQSDPSPSKTHAQLSTKSEGTSTTHLTVADKQGNIVSYTFTIEQIGGSGIVVPGYGFILNNELTDFDLPAPLANSPEAGKRPRSSIAPMLIFAPDGRIHAFGSPGGATIITTVLGIAVNLMDLNLPIDQAIAAPRLSQRNQGSTQVDQGWERSDLGQALKQRGHKLDPIPEMGAATGITLDPDGHVLAAAEPVRRGGGSARVEFPD